MIYSLSTPNFIFQLKNGQPTSYPLIWWRWWVSATKGGRAALATKSVERYSFLVFARSREPTIMRVFFDPPRPHIKRRQKGVNLCGGFGRVKYAPRTPSIIRAPENILYNKRFLGKRRSPLSVVLFAIANC